MMTFTLAAGSGRRKGQSIGLLVFAALCGSSNVLAASVDSVPALPAPTGNVIRVSNEPQLQAAVRTMASGTTVLIAPGIYRLTSTLNIGNRPLKNVALRGATNNRSDVVLLGPGMTNETYGSAPHGVWTGNGVDGVLIANLTISGFYFHPLILNAGTRAPHLYNVRLVDGGEQLLKSNADDRGRGVDNGVVEYSLFEFTERSRSSYTNGIDVLGGAGWFIRDNLFRDITAPTGQLAGPTILMWRGSRDTVVERNTFVNCQREIAFGLQPGAPHDHSGGIIRNNFIYRAASGQGDTAIGVNDSPGTKVLHDSVFISRTYPNAIEYRFAGSIGVVIQNNLTDGPIRSRDGATAVELANYTSALLSMFVDAAGGDLHLTSLAQSVIDAGVASADAGSDWDGQPRSGIPDIGADERPQAQ